MREFHWVCSALPKHLHKPRLDQFIQFGKLLFAEGNQIGELVQYFHNRPLAKLGKAVNIADASNQRKAKSETASAVAVAFREDTKPFDKADSVFHKDTLL